MLKLDLLLRHFGVLACGHADDCSIWGKLGELSLLIRAVTRTLIHSVK